MELLISSRHSSDIEVTVRALVIPKVTSNLPNEKIMTEEWGHLEGLELADPKFYVPGEVDIIIGVHHFFIF